MPVKCVALLSFVFFADCFCGCFARTNSEETDETDAVEDHVSPTPPRRGSATKGEPQVDIGAVNKPSPRPDGAALAKPPNHLSNSTPAASPIATSRNFTIAIDIGHTKARGGAVSAHGVLEYQFNHRLVGELFTSLQSTGFPHSFIINPSGGEIRLVRRAQVANERNANLFLAIHHDSVKDSFLKDWKVDEKTEKFCDDFHGYSVFFSRKNSLAGRSREFAFDLGEALSQAGFTPTLHHAAQEHRPLIDPAKGVYAFDDLLVLKNAKMPAVLLECGVIVNRKEEEDLNDADYRARMIKAIEAGIVKFSDSSSGGSKIN